MYQNKAAHSLLIYSVSVVIDTFTLPCVFTSIANQAEISNSGDVETYPVFVVSCNTAVADSTIIINNLTTHKSITVNDAASAGEVVTIDSFNQTVTSSLNGNITNMVSIDSEFFSLQKGTNRLSAVSAGSTATLQFRENYLGVQL